MTWEKTPWFVGGGALHSADLARTLVFASTSGAEGIVNGPDLKVLALGTPGAAVSVQPGAALLLNRHAGGSQQTYAGRNPTVDEVAITPTGSTGGRTDLVVVRVEDPQYAPWQPPADPATAQYIFTRVIENVDPGVTSAKELNLGYPAIALARITQPASNGAVTQAMITDLRKVAVPRRAEEIFSSYPGANNDLTVTDMGAPQTFPASASHGVDVPSWATHAILRADVAGILAISGATNGGFGVRLGTLAVPNSAFNMPVGDRGMLLAAGAVDIPASMRGTRQTMRATAYRNTNEAGTLRADGGTSAFVSVTFVEAAV